jgi:hypothetical protein
MTSSAVDRAADSDRLGRSLDLYRDLTMALRDRIALLQAGTGEDATCRDAIGVVRDHHKALQTVLEIEASLGKRSKAWADGAGELDLDAARAEIVARLAVWPAEG